MAAFSFDEFVFDDVAFQLTRRGETVKADAQVLDLLGYLLKKPGRVVTKEELIGEIWQGRALGDNVISVCVAKLRKALGGASTRCIGNVYGRGYRFMRPVTRLEVGPELPRTAAPVRARSPAASLVGRSAVLQQLETIVTGVQSGRGAAIALLGEAGIGKTRVAETLDAFASQLGFNVAWGHCHPFGNVPPLWPFLQVLRAWNLPLPEFAWANDTESDELPAKSSHGNVLFMTQTWAETCASRPQVVIIEDVQWADSASLQLLSHLVSTVTQSRVLIVLTVRDTQLPQEQRTRRMLDYVLGHRECRRTNLTRLVKDDIDAYTCALFGASDAALTDAVFAKSDGNPFFMVELLRPFADGDKPLPHALSLTGAALDIVRQGLQLLSPQTSEALAAAAVIGRNFDLGSLSAVTGESPDGLIERLEPAMSNSVIVPQRDSHTHFGFGHDLIRDVLYDDLSSLARARLHLKVADALALRAPNDAALASTEIAHHLLSALPLGDIERAIRAAQQAARSASRVGAYADACVLLRRAREASQLRPEIGPRVSCELLYDLAWFERAAGAPTFAEHLDQAVALARRHGLAHVLVAAAQLVSGPPGTVTSPNGVEILEAALQALPETDCAQRAMLVAHLSWSSPYSWDERRVRELLDRASALAENAGPAAMRTVMRARLYYSAGPDDHERAHALVQCMASLVSTGEERQRARWALEPELTRVLLFVQRGEVDQAQRALDAFGEAGRQLGHTEMIWHYDRLCAIMRMNVGDFEFARARLTDLKQRAEQLQLHGRKTLEMLDWAELNRLTLPLSAAPSSAASLLRPLPNDGPLTHMLKLRLLANFGLHAELGAELAALPVERVVKLPKSRDYLATLGNLAYAAIAVRSVPLSSALYDLLEPYPHFCMTSLSLHCHGVVSRVLGALADVLHRRDAACQHYEQAIVNCKKFGFLPQLAETQYEYASLLQTGESTDRSRVRELAGRALELARQLDMKPLVGASERLLAS